MWRVQMQNLLSAVWYFSGSDVYIIKLIYFNGKEEVFIGV